MNTKHEWTDPKKEPPDTFRLLQAQRRESVFAEYYSPVSQTWTSAGTPDFWQDLASPVPQKSDFEEWWESLPDAFPDMECRTTGGVVFSKAKAFAIIDSYESFKKEREGK